MGNALRLCASDRKPQAAFHTVYESPVKSPLCAIREKTFGDIPTEKLFPRFERLRKKKKRAHSSDSVRIKKN